MRIDVMARMRGVDPFPALLPRRQTRTLPDDLTIGATLPFIVRRLDAGDGGEVQREETSARLRAADAALERLEQLRGRAPGRLVDRLEEGYRARGQQLGQGNAIGDCEPSEVGSYVWLRREAMNAERDEVIAMRDIGAIGDDVLQILEYELDVEALRLAAAYRDTWDGTRH